MSPIQRYSQIYIEREVADDSERIRKRISSYYEKNVRYKTSPRSDISFDYLISSLIEQEIGISVPKYYGPMDTIYEVPDLLEKCLITDFLDILSLIHHVILKAGLSQLSVGWINFIEHVFRQEKSAYSIDNDGLVHPYVDAEFSKNHQDLLLSLNSDRYEHIRKIYENAYISLRADKQDTRTAIKDIFESIESLSKLLDPKIGTLSANEVNNNLKKICEENFSDIDEKNFIKLMISSLAIWVNAHHIYRHGQQKEKHTPPSFESAVFSLSMGSSYIRFLIDIDQKIIRKS